MNIDELYSTRIQKTYDDDQAEIISILSAHTKQPIKLINYYKGLPLSYPAAVVAVERGTVDLNVKAEQAVIIEESRSTFMRSPLLKHDVFAQVQYVNVKRMAASFAKFCYVEIMAERRNFIRMMLDQSPVAVIDSPLGKFVGTLHDLSLSGVNVHLPSFCPLALDTESTIRFTLSGGEQSADCLINIPAKLIAIKDETRPYRYIFTIYPDKTLERQLSQYIFRRQIELIKEIKDTVD